jgi:replicative DNA helicase
VAERIRSEAAVIGSIILEPECIDLVRKYVHDSSYFNDNKFAAVFKVICDLHDKGKEIDLTTIHDNLPDNAKKNIAGFLKDVSDSVISTANVETYAKLVREGYARRRIVSLKKRIDPFDLKKYPTTIDVTNEIDKEIHEVEKIVQASEDLTTSELVQEAMQDIEKKVNKEHSSNIIPTGYIDLDRVILGLEESEHIVLAARPAMGKTTFALNLALRVAKTGKRVIFFSLEMSRKRLMQRLLCIEGKVNSHSIKTGEFSEEEYLRVTRAASSLAQLKFAVYDDLFNLPEMRAKLAQHEAKDNIGLFAIDYLQLVKDNRKKNMSRQQELGDYAYEIARMAKIYKTTAITLSQLNREVEQRQNKRPILSDLYESGAIEASADKVLMLYRDEVYNGDSTNKGIAEIGIAKNRDGETGIARLAFLGENFRFENLARDGWS